MANRAEIYVKGRKFRVIKEGAKLYGYQPIRGGQQGWGKSLQVGEVLTCAGISMSFGDGVPLVKWLDEDGNYIANDCEFKPQVGGMWNLEPKPGYLEPME